MWQFDSASQYQYRRSSVVERRSPKPRQREFKPCRRCQFWTFTCLNSAIPGNAQPVWAVRRARCYLTTGVPTCDGLIPTKNAPARWPLPRDSIPTAGSSVPASARCRSGARSATLRARSTWRVRRLTPPRASPRLRPQPAAFKNSPLKVFGQHDEATVAQMRNCMAVGNVVAGVICADGHLGYAQPVGGVIAYEKQISISGVGFDIGCGNMAVRLDTPYSAIEDRVGDDHPRRVAA